METVTINVEGRPVTVYPQTNLIYARFQSIIAKVYTFIDELTQDVLQVDPSATQDEILLSVGELAQLSARVSPHPRFIRSTDNLSVMREKCYEWVTNPSEDFFELRATAELVKNALVNPDTSPVPLVENSDPNV